MYNNGDNAKQTVREIGKYGIILNSIFTREDTVCVLNDALKSFDEDVLSYTTNLEDDDKAQIKQRLMENIIELLYTKFNGKYYNAVKDYIIMKLNGSDVLHECVLQIFKAFESELYYPCLCGSFSIIEWLIKDDDNPKEYRIENLFERVKNIKEEMCYEDELYVSNMEGFIEEVYNYVDFSNDKSYEFNRNRYMHGRLTRSIRKVDCLKTFSFIYALITLTKGQ